jgi:hypothetical protein
VFLKEKLRHYDTVAARFRDPANPEEKLALRILRQERRRIERRLYPKRWLRLLRRLTVEPVRRQYAARRQAREASRNRQALDNALRQAGFGQTAPKVHESVRQGLAEFTVPVSWYVNEKERMDCRLSFAKDPDGRYRFEGYQASLGQEGKPQESKQQTFRMDATGINSREAYHLLSGRALQPESALREGKWLQLDFTDRDAAGNHRVKEFHPGYDLKQILQALPLKENQSPEAAEKLMVALLGGNRQEVTFEKEGRGQKYSIEANPQSKTVTVYDGHSRKVSLASAIGRKPAETARKVKNTVRAEQHTGKSGKNGLSVR